MCRIILFGLLVFCSKLRAQTNSSVVPTNLFSAPELRIRLVDAEQAKSSSTNQDPMRSSPLGPMAVEQITWTNSHRGNSFDALSASGGLNKFNQQIYERLERGGYFTRPE